MPERSIRMTDMDIPARFRCRQCGACCRQVGYVHLTDDDIDKLAQHLGIPVEEFTTRYTRLSENRAGLALNEESDHACIFLSTDNQCMMQAVKPRQCRDFPQGWTFEGFHEECPEALEGTL